MAAGPGMKQVGLLAAGCQPWNADVCAASGDRFAYCATLAIYIYELDHRFNEFKLACIMSEHKKTITAVAWHPTARDLLASSSTDRLVVVYHVGDKNVLARITVSRAPPTTLQWLPQGGADAVAYLSGRGPLCLWSYTVTGTGGNSANNISMQKDIGGFVADVCTFRLHPKKAGKMAVGHVDGSISLFCPGHKPQKHILRPLDDDGANEDEEDPISALEWDPLSVDYLLIANTHLGVRLVDTSGHGSASIIMTFVLPSAAAQVHTLSWISSAPGMFVTGDSHTGTMRVWTVAKSTPLENLKLKKTGFHALHVFHTKPAEDGDCSSNDIPLGLSPSGPVLSPTNHYTIPPAFAVCTFLDGGVGLYDLSKRRWYFLRDQGHIETIFDCKFKPDNSDFLATGSFDGTIKIWDVNTLTAVQTSPGNEGVIYSLSWAPADLNCIAAGTSRHGAFLWDVRKGKVIKRFTEHGKASVYSVAWNHKEAKRIATAGADGYCVVRQVDGQLIAKYKHPGAVYGCDWSPNNKDMLATGCEDKCVRVFYIPSSNDSSMRTFTGHTAKVFHVKWSPLRDGLLASGSDDGTVRVWDYSQERCVVVLQGHTAPVRGLLWNPEIPYLLISGSWDYTIRLWDVRDGACIDTSNDHGADVYGLTSHPAKPFTMASCSRDSTVRIWNLTPLVQPLEINILAGKPWDEVMASPEHSMAIGTPALLCGRGSKELKMKMDRLTSSNPHLNILQMFSLFFASPGGTDNLWELVAVIKGMDESLLSTKYPKGIMHMKHLTLFKASKAQQLEMVKTCKYGGGIGSPTKEESLREAAAIEVRLGNLQKYCEILVQLGEWDKALSVAPGVSMAYWKSLAERHAKQLMGEDSDATVPYCVATGMVEELVEFFSHRGQFNDALMTAVAGYEGNISVPVVGGNARALNGGQEENAGETQYKQTVQKTSEALADWYFRNGSPVLAACCHLSVEDHQRAVAKLVRGNELELAASVGTVLGHTPELTNTALELLARRCERLGKWELAVDLLRTIPDSELHLAKCCARCAASLAEIDDLHKRAGFPATEECQEEGERAQKEGNLLRAIQYFLLSSTPETGLDIGIKYCRDKISKSSFEADDVFEILHLMASIQTEKLQQHKCTRYRNELMVFCAYVGALVALRRGYHAVVNPLLTHVRFLMHREPGKLVLSENLVMSELDAYTVHQAVHQQQENQYLANSKKDSSITVEQQSTYNKLLKKAGKETSPIGCGADSFTGSQYPSHSDVHMSHFTQQRIQGPAFFLEDGRSAISINEALMWAKVNPFSPLGSGVRINPF